MREIEEDWSLLDLLDANIALDVWDDLAAESARKTRRAAREAANR